MFGWLKARKEQRRLAKRGIYRFWDGEQWRYADPLRIWQGIFRHPTVNFVRDLEAVDEGIEPTTTEVLNGICEIFAVQRFDDATRRGLTSWELVDMLNEYFAWLESQKKSTSSGPTSTEPSEPEYSSSMAAPPGDTKPSADSGPVVSESTSAPPIESSTA